MNRKRSVPLLLLLASLTALPGALPQDIEDADTAYIDGKKAAVIAFLPPSMKDSQDKVSAEAHEGIRAALEITRQCLGEDSVSYQVIFAQRIVVRSHGREETFEVGHFAPLVGALLLRPGSNPRILFAGGGPDALALTLRSAASAYFGKGCNGG